MQPAQIATDYPVMICSGNFQPTARDCLVQARISGQLSSYVIRSYTAI